MKKSKKTANTQLDRNYETSASLINPIVRLSFIALIVRTGSPRPLFRKMIYEMHWTKYQQLDRKGHSNGQQPATLKNKKAQAECMNEYYKRIYEKYGTFLKNRSNPQDTKRYQKPDFQNSESTDYIPTIPITVWKYRRYDKRYQSNTFGNVLKTRSTMI